MRRYFRFGAVGGNNQNLEYKVGEDWNQVQPYYISMGHKLDIWTNLKLGWSFGTPEKVIWIQQVSFIDQAYVDPAPDCTAIHYQYGYGPYGGLSPLPVYLLNGFYNRDFTSCPPVFRESYTKPGT